MYRNAGSIELSVGGRSGPEGEPSLEELAQLADRVVERAGTVRRRYEEIATELGAPDELRHGGEHEQAEPAPPGPAPADTLPPRENVRLAAFEMALVGDTRETTRDYLVRTFGLADIDDILDDVFGVPESDAGETRRRRLFRRRRD